MSVKFSTITVIYRKP